MMRPDCSVLAPPPSIFAPPARARDASTVRRRARPAPRRAARPRARTPPRPRAARPPRAARAARWACRRGTAARRAVRTTLIPQPARGQSVGRPSGRNFVTSGRAAWRGETMQLVAAILLLLAPRGPAAGRRRRRATRARTARRTRRCGARARLGAVLARHYCSGMPPASAARAPPGARRVGLASAGRDGARAGARVPCGERERDGGARAEARTSTARRRRRADAGLARALLDARGRRRGDAHGRGAVRGGRYCAAASARVPGGVRRRAAPDVGRVLGACERVSTARRLDLAARAACGPEPTRFCPAGSSQRRDVRPGHVAVRRGGAVGHTAERPGAIGEYVIDGVARPCPAGRAATPRQRNASCAGRAARGTTAPRAR